LPDFLSYAVERDGGVTYVNKKTVFVVNDKSLDEFFDKIIDLEGFEGLSSE
jgi:hypothetical protein